MAYSPNSFSIKAKRVAGRSAISALRRVVFPDPKNPVNMVIALDIRFVFIVNGVEQSPVRLGIWDDADSHHRCPRPIAVDYPVDIAKYSGGSFGRGTTVSQ